MTDQALELSLLQKATELSIPHIVWTLIAEDGSFALFGNDDEEGPIIFFTEEKVVDFAEKKFVDDEVTLRSLQLMGEPIALLSLFLNQAIVNKSNVLYVCDQESVTVVNVSHRA